jgi:homocysteine S-methyltransferase
MTPDLDPLYPLPHAQGPFFLTDGGLETTLIFLEGVELPYFASFPLLLDQAGRDRLERYYEPYILTARERGLGFILDVPTWRANADWGAKLGYSPDDLVTINRQAIAWAQDYRSRFASDATPIVISGVLGPRGDGYRADTHMTADEAQSYHSAQIGAFRDAGADVVSAMTITYSDEAVGIVRAARELGVPCVVSFTVETNGHLASGETLGAAIEKVDQATGGGPAYYMINCAHPVHFERELLSGEAWTRRVRGVRANASSKSHAELDEATDLDPGDPVDLASRYRDLLSRLKHLSVVGGCCGTDHRHIAAICESCLPATVVPASASG